MSKLSDYLIQNPLYQYGEQGRKPDLSPVQSPLEGLARALTGGVYGVAAGIGASQAKKEQTTDQSVLSQALLQYGTDPDAAAKLLATRPNLSDISTGLLTQQATLKRAEELAKFNQGLETDRQKADMQAFGITPGGAPPTATAVGGATASPQTFGNNPGNIRVSPAAWEGKGQPYNGFETFDTPEHGAQAQYKNFQAYVKDNPNITLGQAIAKWTPPNENNTQSAVQTITQGAGIHPDTPLAQVLANPQAAAKVLEVQTRLEKGGLPQGFTPQTFAGAVQPQGQAQAPQGAYNPQPAADTIQFQGLSLPRPAVAAAMMISDHKERQKALQTIVLAEHNRQNPVAGSKEGDIAILQRGDPRSPEYAQAHARIGAPQMSQGGQLLYPDMSVYSTPGGQVSPQAGPRFVDTPQGEFERSKSFAKDFSEHPIVKAYEQVTPVIQSMREAAARGGKAADVNIVSGLANLYSPGAGSLPRPQMMEKLASTGSIPEEVMRIIGGAVSGHGMGEAERGRLMAEAESRYKALGDQFNAVKQQVGARAKSFGVDPEKVFGMATQGQQEPQTQGRQLKYNPATGKVE